MEKLSQGKLPHLLVQSVKDQRAVLIFGAGASMECKDKSGNTPPSGKQLRDHLAKKFLGTTNESRDLATVAEMAIVNGAGEPHVFEEIATQMDGFQPSMAHSKIADFQWRAIATTNYDTFIEQGFAKNSCRKQNCVPFVKNYEPYDDRLKRATNALPVLKLHGCINHRLDPDIPLILSHEHYQSHKANREHLFERLRQWAQSLPLIFIGYSVRDNHIRQLFYDIDPKKRPQWYIVTPSADEHDRRFWAAKGTDIIECTFSGFVMSLDEQIPEVNRALRIPVAVADAPYTRFFRSNDLGSEVLRNSLQTDLEYIHSGMSFDEVPPSKFYSGHDHGWCGIIRNYDFARRAGNNLLYALLDEEEASKPRFFLLHGSAGAGKTIALRRVALNAATELDQLVLWLQDAGQPRAEVVEELFNQTGKRPLLFVDRVSMHSDAILELFKKMIAKSVPITVVAAEREADWGSYCGKLEEFLAPNLHFLRRLSQREAEDLVDLLECHNCLGLLEDRPKSERVAAFLDDDRANRHLLVALHELTQGKPFEKIILEEFERIVPDAARQLYLDVATMHQFGAVARAGAISRISGIRFTDFEDRFFNPLRDIVSVTTDSYTGDRSYESRHAHVSNILFCVACPSDVDKSSQLSRILTGIDVGYSSDRRILDKICKGKTIVENFLNIDAARGVFNAAICALPKSAFLYQQYAILEYQHKHGSLDRAEEFANQARIIDKSNHIYLHTLAEIKRRKAKAAHSIVSRDNLRAQSRSYLNEIRVRDSRKDLTYCKLLVDEAVDLLRRLTDDPKDHELIEFDKKVEDAVDGLRRAQHEFPKVAEFPIAEGDLWERLGKERKASQALVKAIAVKPRNPGAFTRLSRILHGNGSYSEAVETLEKALDRFPNDKDVHLQAALKKLEINRESSEIEFHFRSSFGPGDQRFDARFFFAEYLFLIDKKNDCKEMFEEIDARAPRNFRVTEPASDDLITAKISKHTGTIESIKERYLFIRSGGYLTSIFAHMSSLANRTIDEMEVGMVAEFGIRFNRRGPVAVYINIV